MGGPGRRCMSLNTGGLRVRVYARANTDVWNSITPRRSPGAWAEAAGGAQPAGTRAEAAATNAAMTPLAVSASGCHCTPSTNRRGPGSIPLDRLGQAVQGRDPAHDQPLPQPVDALVVMRLGRVRKLARDTRGQRALAQQDIMVGAVERADHAAMPTVTEQLGQVLQQRAAAGDVDQLHPPADPQHRQVPLDRRAGQGDLERVALGHRVHGLRVRPLAVAAGVDVGAAGKHEPVDQLQRLLRILGHGRVHCQHQREPASPLHRLHVVVRQQRRPQVPHAPAGPLQGRAHADHGTPARVHRAHDTQALQPIGSPMRRPSQYPAPDPRRRGTCSVTPRPCPVQQTQQGGQPE